MPSTAFSLGFCVPRAPPPPFPPFGCFIRQAACRHRSAALPLLLIVWGPENINCICSLLRVRLRTTWVAIGRIGFFGSDHWIRQAMTDLRVFVMLMQLYFLNTIATTQTHTERRKPGTPQPALFAADAKKKIGTKSATITATCRTVSFKASRMIKCRMCRWERKTDC